MGREREDRIVTGKTKLTVPILQIEYFKMNTHYRVPVLLIAAILVIILCLACSESVEDSIVGEHWGCVNNGLIPAQKLRAEQLISLFENGTIEIQYGYAEALDDGRGITCGRAGFTTGTGDAYIVVKRYTDKVPDNVLAKYLPELSRLNTADDPGDISGLNGFIADWRSLGTDATFRSVQDTVVDELYYRPSVAYSDSLCLETALARAVLYDTIIQHGDGDDPDGLPALLKRTEDKVGGTPKTGIDEKTWLNSFLAIRRADLAHSYDESTRETWAESVSRCDVFSFIAESGNYNLDGPIVINTGDYENVVIP